MGERIPRLRDAWSGAYFANSLISPVDAARKAAVEMCVARPGVPFIGVAPPTNRVGLLGCAWVAELRTACTILPSLALGRATIYSVDKDLRGAENQFSRPARSATPSPLRHRAENCLLCGLFDFLNPAHIGLEYCRVWPLCHQAAGNFREWQPGFFRPPTPIRSRYARTQTSYLSFPAFGRQRMFARLAWKASKLLQEEISRKTC